MNIRPIAPHHWQYVLEIQQQAYVELEPEDLSVLQSKWRVSPGTCFVCERENGGVAGYLLAHPWGNAEPPKLYETLPDCEHCDELFLHDLAISPQDKGRGIGSSLVRGLLERARVARYCIVRLVAVQGSELFWSLHGFKQVQSTAVYNSYGENAVLMEQKLLV